MYQATQSIHPLQPIFGGGYVPERRDDDCLSSLLPKEKTDFAAILKSLRAALGIRQAASPACFKITSIPRD
jgi:hypothetical protein